MRNRYAVAVLLLAGLARVQGAELELSSYTAAALACSPEVRSAEDAYRAAEAAYKATLANLLLPTLAFTGTAYPWGDDPQNSYRFNTWRLNRDDMFFSTTLNLNLFNSFQDKQKARAAFAAREAALRAWTAERQDRAFAAVQAFYDLDSKNEQLAVARQNLGGQERQYRQSMDLYKHGMLSLADLLKSETDWRSSQMRLASAEAEAKTALVGLNLLIDRPVLEGVQLRADLATGTTTLPEIGPDLVRALKQRPEVARAKDLLQASQIAYQQALQGILPTFQVNATLNRNDTSGIPNPNYYLGLSLSLPVSFNGVSQALAAAQARANRKAAQEALASAERTARQEVAQTFVSLEKSVQTYALAQLKAEIAKRTLDLVAEQYSQGSADAIRMNQAQNDYLDARVSFARALHDIFIDRARYKRAVGDPLW